MEITYRYATTDDAYGIQYVAAHSWKETYTGLLPDEYLDNRIKNIPNKVENTKEYLSNHKGKYIVALDKDKIVGIMDVTDSMEEKYKEYGHLGALYVLKEYQGLGIGKRLFKMAVEELMNMGYSKMQLECMSGNKTIEFYKKYTGVIVDVIDYPIKNAGTVTADIVLFEDLEEVFNKINGRGITK